jgi:hypothetical protein
MTSIVLATLMLVSLFAAVSSAATVSGTTMAGTGPAVTSSGGAPPAGFSGFLDYFAVDSSGTVWHEGCSTWDSLGGVSTSSPAAICWNDPNTYRSDVFVRGSDGALWHKDYQNGWSKWESLGGQLASGTGPAVSSWSAGRLDVFVQGTDGALWHKWWNGAQWSGWESLGGKLTSSPAARAYINNPNSNAANYIDVFVRGSDGAVWWKLWNGRAWSSWTSLGGKLAANTGPAASGYSSYLFVQGTDHQLWQKSGFGGSAWTAWGTLGGKPPETLSASSPAATLPPNDHTTVSVTSTSGNVWSSMHSLNGLWDTWSSLGSPP